MNTEQSDHLTDREKTLVAMGAAMGAGCRTCADKLYGIAVSLGIPEAEMMMALTGGLEAKAQAVRTMEVKISTLVGRAGAKGTSVSEEHDRLSSLVRIAASVAANSAPDAVMEMRNARVQGIPSEQIGIAVSLAKMVRKNAISFSDQEISDDDCGLQFGRAETCCPPFPRYGERLGLLLWLRRRQRLLPAAEARFSRFFCDGAPGVGRAIRAGKKSENMLQGYRRSSAETSHAQGGGLRMIPHRCVVLAAFVLLTGGALRDALGQERIGMANPASVYCVQSGYKLEIRTGTDGGQHGACLFPDGAECEEWAFFRDECGSRYRKIPDNLPETIRSERR